MVVVPIPCHVLILLCFNPLTGGEFLPATPKKGIPENKLKAVLERLGVEALLRSILKENTLDFHP